MPNNIIENSVIKEINKVQKQNLDKVLHFLPKSLEQRENKMFHKLQKHKGNSFTKLKALYSFMDELYAFVGKFIPCKKECTFCCYYEVSISELEVRYIEKFANTKRLKKSYLLPNGPHGTPCSLLKNNICSIYEYRPFFCRRCINLYHSNQFCHPNLAFGYNGMTLHFSEVDKSYNLIIEQSFLDVRYDIREVF
jgi:Fe-S-cluster containining protein